MRNVDGTGAWMIGAVLILLGLIFLAQNLSGFPLIHNWWALFILIPGVGSLITAWRYYQTAGGHLSPPARGSLITGLIILMVAAFFLFNLSWTLFGPLIIIMGGVGVLLNVLLPG